MVHLASFPPLVVNSSELEITSAYKLTLQPAICRRASKDTDMNKTTVVANRGREDAENGEQRS